MGEVLFHTGVAFAAVTAIARLIARVPGRLSIVAVAGGTVFSALSGSTIANTAMLGIAAAARHAEARLSPDHGDGADHGGGRHRHADPAFGAGRAARQPRQDSRRRAADRRHRARPADGGMFVGYVIIRCAINPALAPAYDGGDRSVAADLAALRRSMCCRCSGSSWSSSAACWRAGRRRPNRRRSARVASIVAAAAYRGLTCGELRCSLLETGKISAMILFIIAAPATFSQILAFSGATDGLLARSAGARSVAVLACGRDACRSCCSSAASSIRSA